MRELIYKDEAYKAIDNCIRDSWDRISPADAKMNICHLVSDANEADRPQGEWIIEIDVNGYTYGRCSICNMRQYAGQLNFCPDCGAKMKRGRQ